MATYYVPRNAITDIYCPNCGKILFVFNPNKLFAPISEYAAWDRFLKRGGRCKNCGFVFEEIDKTIFMVHDCNFGLNQTLLDALIKRNDPAADVILGKVKRYKLSIYPSPRKH